MKISRVTPLKDEQTTLAVLAIVLAVAALMAVGCGGGGGSSAGTTTPSNTTTPAVVTVNIFGIAGSAAFSPNPIQNVASGASITWRNSSAAAHDLVMDDGAVIGSVPVGGTLTKTLSGSGGDYHCTTHPTMVGSINGTSAPPEPTPNPSGGYDY